MGTGGSDDAAKVRPAGWTSHGLTLLAFALPFLLWEAGTWGLRLTEVSEVVYRDPLGVLRHLLWDENAADHRASLASAL